jgi:hypothetical protein
MVTTASIITNIDDVTLVDMPVTYLTRKNGEDVREIRHEPQAKLFVAEDRAARKPATVVMSTAYGDPFVEIGRLRSAVIHQIKDNRGMLHISFIPPGKRNDKYYQRHFPVDAVLLMWGTHDIPLDDLPLLTTSMRWHCSNYAATWQEVSRRCRATGQCWFDTHAAAVEWNIERQKQRLERERYMAEQGLTP